MGKIRIKTLGDEAEKKQKQSDKIRREEKKKRLVHLEGMKGGAKVVDMGEGPVIEENKAASETEIKPPDLTKEKPVHLRGQAYLKVSKLINNKKDYSIKEAIELVKKTSFSRFDGSVEVHLNVAEKGLRGQVDLPHGIGKEIRVKIVDDALIEQLDSGKIDFDILVAHPLMMAKLVKFAKLLGPKGLMPNPKTGTISDKPEETAKKLSSGQMQFKTEPEFPIIHFVVGKVSFSDTQLSENFLALTKAIGQDKIKSAFLKATMSPSVRVKI